MRFPPLLQHIDNFFLQRYIKISRQNLQGTGFSVPHLLHKPVFVTVGETSPLRVIFMDCYDRRELSAK